MGFCSRCHQKKPKDRWKWCEACRKRQRLAAQQWRLVHPEESKVYQREWYRAVRAEVLAHCGKGCACCGEQTFEFLTIDHIDGGGRDHRDEVGKRGTEFLRWLRKNGYPKGYQVLCYNCNMARGYWKVCPHQSR